MEGWRDGWRDGGTDGWMGGGMDGRVDNRGLSSARIAHGAARVAPSVRCACAGSRARADGEHTHARTHTHTHTHTHTRARTHTHTHLRRARAGPRARGRWRTCTRARTGCRWGGRGCGPTRRRARCSSAARASRPRWVEQRLEWRGGPAARLACFKEPSAARAARPRWVRRSAAEGELRAPRFQGAGRASRPRRGHLRGGGFRRCCLQGVGRRRPAARRPRAARPGRPWPCVCVRACVRACVLASLSPLLLGVDSGALLGVRAAALWCTSSGGGGGRGARPTSLRPAQDSGSRTRARARQVT